MLVKSYQEYIDNFMQMGDMMPSLLLYSNKDENGSEEIIHSQQFCRPVDGKEIELFGLWDVKFLPENQRKGRFKKIIEIMEQKPYPVMVNDIVNPVVSDYLKKRGWRAMIFPKNGVNVHAMVKLK